ncbi:hypothetical protein BN132_3823 [Cronobacter turicensis 564]|nr:hypothetical protein BN132_3823 [Cronobacter turicensis 564]
MAATQQTQTCQGVHCLPQRRSAHQTEMATNVLTAGGLLPESQV